MVRNSILLPSQYTCINKEDSGAIHLAFAESVQRGATILYATHIFDGLDGFPTHVAHLSDGQFVMHPTPWPFPQDLIHKHTSALVKNSGSSLHALALAWLTEDREVRREAEQSGRLVKTRGARQVRMLKTVSLFFYICMPDH